MNKFITKQGSRLAALAAGIVLFSFTATAQDLVNSKKVNNVAGGVIKFNNDNGKFTNNNANTAQITNAGTIQMLGTDNQFDGTTPLATAAARVPGLVSYADNAVGNQNIFPGYYTDLDMADNATKQFGAGQIFISGNYTTAGEDRVYGTSLITYDGTGAQAIAAENLTNGGGYNNVDFTNAGLKTLSAGIALVNGTTGIDASTTGGGVAVNGATAVLTATGDLTQDAGAGDLSVLGAGTVNINGATNALGANAVVTDGTLALGDGTNPSATTVTGALSLTGATGLLAANAVSTLNVDGGFTNADATRTNMTFAANSTIDYQDGASNIVTTASTNPYGAFIISKSNGPINAINNGGTENDLEIATSFAMSGGSGNNLDMLNSTGGMVNLTSGTAGNVTYAGNEEVVGEFRRTHAAVTGVDYVFNNSATIANFTTAPTGGNYFAVIVNPDGTTAQYDPTRDIKRDINIDYDYTAWVADITAGYQASDVNEDGGWDGSYNEAQIRFREGDASTTEKVSTGNTYTRVASGAGSLGSVKLPGFKPTAAAVDGLADDEFLANNDLILRAGPAIWYSVNPGRWSNPATWDEGTEPPTDAEVVIRHNVWAGFVRPYDGYAIPEATPGAMATKITIQEQNATFPTPTLMIGNDATYPGAFATSTVPVAGITDPGRIIVENVTAPNFLPDYVNEEVTNTNNYIDGLVVFGGAELTASESLINDGCVNVGGTLGIGQ
jgi:hypothetical protein